MKTLIYSIGYEREFIKQANVGWGCGYIYIPSGHPFLKAMAEVKPIDEEYDWGQLQIPNFDEEITWDSMETVNEIEYRVLGFDMAHSHNNMDNSGKSVVLAQVIKMQEIVDSYVPKELTYTQEEVMQMLREYRTDAWINSHSRYHLELWIAHKFNINEAEHFSKNK